MPSLDKALRRDQKKNKNKFKVRPDVTSLSKEKQKKKLQKNWNAIRKLKEDMINDWSI